MPELAAAETGSRALARAIAFYLPQYHPVRENDEWWGTGFSEWRNTAKARPLFRGHSQPHLPGELGFYDLRVSETREQQAELARSHGVEAFCYWHYWFAGRRILERPFDEVLASGRPSLSFCLGWANQSWTGTWYGAEDRLLIRQTYPGDEDDRRHFAHLLSAFRDERYLRVNGRPVFYIFRPELLPDAGQCVEQWQDMAKKAGLGGLYLVAEISDMVGEGPVYANAAADGFDVGVYMRLPADTNTHRLRNQRVIRKGLSWPRVYEHSARPPMASGDSRWLTAVYPNWDNTPRSQHRGIVVTGSTPTQFATHVREVTASLQDRPPQERLLFVKSWNEWAEGNYLEPDLEHGRAWLEALWEGLTCSVGT